VAERSRVGGSVCALLAPVFSALQRGAWHNFEGAVRLQLTVHPGHSHALDGFGRAEPTYRRASLQAQ
jgi:hypothetical protein